MFRDEVGKNLALGLGEGFTDEMGKVTKDINSSIPTDFEVNGAYNMSTNNIGGIDFSVLSNMISGAVTTALNNVSGDTVLIVGNEELARAVNKGRLSLNRRMDLVLE